MGPETYYWRRKTAKERKCVYILYRFLEKLDTMAGMGSIPEIEKLKETNYANCKINMKTILQYHDCWDFIEDIDPPRPRGSDATSRALDDYNRRKRQSKVLILLNCERSFQRIVENTKSAYEVWQNLKRMFEPKNGLRMVRVLRSFIEVKYDSELNEQISVYIERFKEKLEELRE